MDEDRTKTPSTVGCIAMQKRYLLLNSTTHVDTFSMQRIAALRRERCDLYEGKSLSWVLPRL
jgi:hypothetical protein